MAGKLLARPERREAILRAAADAFAHRGFASTSMDDVAAAAGITRLIVYRHFDSKEKLYGAVLARVSTRLREEFEHAGDTLRSIAAARALLVVGREDPAALTLLWRHAAREPQFAEHAEAFREQVIDFARGLLGSVGMAAGLPERWAAETLVSYVFDAVLHWLEDGAPDDDEHFLALMAASLPAIVVAWSKVRPGGR